jgi:hydrogenase maturation protease
VSKTLLLGLGNDLLTDDSIGLRLAAVARERLAHNPNITVAQTCEMGLSLLDFVVGFDHLLLVDAIQTGRGPPGFVHQIEGFDGHLLPTLSPHFLGVGEALALGRKLGLPVPQCVRILAIEVEDLFTVSQELSPTLQAAFPRLTDQIINAAEAMSC